MCLSFNFITFIEDGKTGGGKDASGMYSVSLSVTLHEEHFGIYILLVRSRQFYIIKLCLLLDFYKPSFDYNIHI